MTPRLLRTAIALGALVGPALGVASPTAGQEASPAAGQDAGGAGELRGSWHAETYVLADGSTHEVSGQIHFTERDWLVLFFVMDGGEPARGSAEGGRYTLAGDRLTFEHLHNLSTGKALPGFAESPLRMETRSGDGTLESARVEIMGKQMTLFFPSGNRMTFRRGSNP